MTICKDPSTSMKKGSSPTLKLHLRLRSPKWSLVYKNINIDKSRDNVHSINQQHSIDTYLYQFVRVIITYKVARANMR